jgi:hypothetical protein
VARQVTIGHSGFEAFAVTEAVPAPKLDVFLSYKREERDVAEALARDLITRGYDVWWDAALLAGEDFAKIVHAELTEARAVVVLWSKQARSSHWVRAEAALALANGTLINTVIDGMAFEGIPPEYSTIQAIRLGEDPAAFHAEIAAAIARKGATPSHGGRTTAEATSALAEKVKDSEFFGVIANSSHVGDFKEYLDRFGPAAQFAGMARRRIATLGAEDKRRRSLFRRLKVAAGVIAATVTFMVGLEQLVGIKFSAMLGLDRLFATNVTQPDTNGSGTRPVIAVTPVATADDGEVTAIPEILPDPIPSASIPDSMFTRTGPGSMAAEVLNRRAVRLEETSRTSGLANITAGDVIWVSGATGELERYAADITFAWGGTARVAFRIGPVSSGFAPHLLLTYKDEFGQGPMAGVSGITGLLADGERLGLAETFVETDKLAVSLLDTGRSDGSFERLIDATTITLELAFGDDFGTLQIGKPAGEPALRAALFPLSSSAPNALSGDLSTLPSDTPAAHQTSAAD